MIRWLMVPLLLLAAGGAAAQSPANPPVGAVWTYQGATTGPGWVVQVPTPPITMTDNHTTPVTIDAASLTVATRPGLTANQIVNYIFCTSACATPQNFDAMRGVSDLISGSTIGLVNGVGGYVLVNAPISGFAPTSVALFGAGVVNVNNGRVWGINTTLSDCEYRNAATCAGATGRQLYNELDLSFSNTTSVGTALQILGNSVVQPSNATGVTLAYLDQNSLGTVAKWGNFLYSLDGSTQNFAHIGTLQNGGTSIDGQPITFGATNSSGTGVLGVQQFMATGLMNFSVQVKSVGLVSHPSANKNLTLGPNVDLPSGTAISSTVDAGGLAPLEILASGLSIDTPVQLQSYTVSTLPGCSTTVLTYALAIVTDAVAPTYGSVVSGTGGGGTVKTPVFCNGVAWVAH